MTILDFLKYRLIDNFVPPHGADEILKRVQEDPGNEGMRGRWTDHAEGNPPQLLSTLWLSTQKKALQWIDENCPQAFYRVMFEDA